MEVINNELRIVGDYTGLNFSINKHVTKIGNVNSPHYCIQIPKNVSTVIIYGTLKDSKVTYIELPLGVSAGHTIEFLESSGSTEDYKIMVAPIFYALDTGQYIGRHIYSNGSTNNMSFTGSTSNPIVHYDNTYSYGKLYGRYVSLPVHTRKIFTYVGNNPNDDTESGTWIG
jgi:hypothetical protein